METNLDYHNLISATGSKGIMQLTTVALKDLKKNINKFPEDLQPQLKNKLDIKDRYQLYEKLFNIEDNIFLGMAYLKLLEQTYLPNAKHKLVGWIKKLTSHPTYYNLDKVV
jgi:soluble lytic murein transglycosylase-like protein